jgi:BirA family biotin operon repressor/biotin-[acetyl-CoA-carboxylase] ligase
MRRSVRRVPNRWSDLARPALSVDRIERALSGDPVWRGVDVVDSTASTNADLVAAARDGSPAGTVLLAEEQVAGRGRLDRRWVSPPRAAVLMSVLLRPATPPPTWPLLPLVAGVALADAIRGMGTAVTLKWPNDVLVGEAKIAGILVERTGDAVVIGIGINVTTRAEELPIETATSLLLEGGTTDRERVAVEVLQRLSACYTAWCDANGAPRAVVPAYRERCGTIGRVVSVALADGATLRGVADAVDDAGRLLVRTADGGRQALSVGDVHHLRGSDQGC